MNDRKKHINDQYDQESSEINKRFAIMVAGVVVVLVFIGLIIVI